MDWKFKATRSPMCLGQSSQFIKSHGVGNRDRIWKVEPVDTNAGFKFVYKDGSGVERFVPRWADFTSAIELSSNSPDSFVKGNPITSVFLMPDIVSQGESTPGFLYDDDGSANVRVYLHPTDSWKITQEWLPENEESSWTANPNDQYLKRLTDDYTKVGNITPAGTVEKRDGRPSAWIWNTRSPRRWKGINVEGNDWVVVLDKKGTEKLESVLWRVTSFYRAINRKAWIN